MGLASPAPNVPLKLPQDSTKPRKMLSFWQMWPPWTRPKQERPVNNGKTAEMKPAVKLKYMDSSKPMTACRAKCKNCVRKTLEPRYLPCT